MSLPDDPVPPAGAGRSTRPRRVRRAGRGAVVPAAVVVALVALWEIGVRMLDIPSFLLPGPGAVAVAATTLGLGPWLAHLGATLEIVLGGYALSILVGVPSGVAIASVPRLAAALLPLLALARALPLVAVAPIVVAVMGTGDPPRLMIAVLAAVAPIAASTATGLRATPPELVELSRWLRAGPVRQLREIRIPWALPYVFDALRASVTLCVVAAVVTEFVAADRGLGYLIRVSSTYFRMPEAIAGLAALALVSLLLVQAVAWVEGIVCPWSRPGRTAAEAEAEAEADAAGR